MTRRYANLWNSMIKRRHDDNNGTFYVYMENITYLVAHTLHISTKMVEKYKEITHFKACMHHMYV
jgi:sulfatase maturation enzyme AslB (radical SAM superfamily)